MEALGLDIKLLIAQIVNFAIFYFIFQKFVAKPLLSYIKKQKEDEKKRHDLSVDLEKARTSIEEEKQSMIKSMNAKQKELIKESKDYAENLKNELVDKAKKQADELVVAGKEMVEEERRKAQIELEKYVKVAAQKALLQSIGENLDEDTKKKITKNIIDTL
ncbi:MAG: hypothetical protein U0525_05040 [Patescibacteria group bacterium]